MQVSYQTRIAEVFAFQRMHHGPISGVSNSLHSSGAIAKPPMMILSLTIESA